MKDWQSQAHVKWECKYPVVIVPKYRRKVMYGKLRHQMGEIFRQLCRQKGIELLQCLTDVMAPFRGLPHTTGSAGGLDYAWCPQISESLESLRPLHQPIRPSTLTVLSKGLKLAI